MPLLCHAATAVRAASAAKTIITAALTLTFLAGTAVAQQPAAVAPDASKAVAEPAPGSRASFVHCYLVWNLRFPTQTALAQSIDRCTATIQSKPHPVALACAYFNRGLAYAGLRDYARAILDYDEAIKLMPRYPQAYKNRGIAYQELRDYPRAMADYNEAIRQNGDLDSAFHNRADLYYSRGDLAHAVADYSEAIRLVPRNATYYRSRAQAYRAQNDEVRATADLDEWERLTASTRILQAPPDWGC